MKYINTIKSPDLLFSTFTCIDFCNLVHKAIKTFLQNS